MGIGTMGIGTVWVGTMGIGTIWVTAIVSVVEVWGWESGNLLSTVKSSGESNLGSGNISGIIKVGRGNSSWSKGSVLTSLSSSKSSGMGSLGSCNLGGILNGHG